MAKIYTIEKTINGTVYKAQFNGIGAALEAIDSSYIDGSSNTSTMKLSKYLFEHVIVEPKGLTVNDFDSIEEFNEVITFAREVMQGNFHDKQVESKAEGKSAK